SPRRSARRHEETDERESSMDLAGNYNGRPLPGILLRRSAWSDRVLRHSGSRPGRKDRHMTQQPQSGGGILEYRRSPRGVREIAQRQRGIIMCILGLFVFYGAMIAGQTKLPPMVLLGLAGGMLALDITAMVFVFLLTTKLYGVGVGILLGILTFAPCVGLITLLVVNAKATAILKEAGLKV